MKHGSASVRTNQHVNPFHCSSWFHCRVWLGLLLLFGALFQPTQAWLSNTHLTTPRTFRTRQFSTLQLSDASASPGSELPLQQQEGDETTIQSLERIASSSSSDRASSANNKDSSSYSLVDMAASITQDNCQLLGVKSLGVDYGLVRTGLAVTVGFDPQPLAILQEVNATTAQVCDAILQYANNEQVQRIIVGLPLHKNGTIAEQTNLTLAFGRELMQKAWSSLGPDVPVIFFDERYTSKEAAARAHSRNPDSHLYGTLDADAACIILENYYQDNGEGAHILELPEDTRRQCLERYQLKQQAQAFERQAMLQERELRMQRRKDAIERSKQEDQHSGTGVSKKKRKKKKKRRR